MGYRSKFLFALPIVALLTACEGHMASDQASKCGDEPVSVKQARFVAYDDTVHPLVISANCADCHDGKSGKAPYPHSAAKASDAYAAGRSLVDFGTPTTSRLVKKVLTNHNCGNEGQCRGLADRLESAIATWAQKEGLLPAPPSCAGDLASGLTVILPGKAIKPADFSKGTDVDLRWDVGAVNPVVGKVLLSIKARNFGDPTATSFGTYQLSFPTLATQDHRLEVVSAVPTINGVAAPQYANWAGAAFVYDSSFFDATATILGFAPFSDYSMIMNWTKIPAGDLLGWTVIVRESSQPASESTRTPACKAPKAFKVVYDNVLAYRILSGGSYVGRCTRCHGDPTQPANIAMNLSNQGRDACLEALMRVNFADPRNSLLLLKPSRRDPTTDHPELYDFFTDPTLASGLSNILHWIDRETAGVDDP